MFNLRRNEMTSSSIPATASVERPLSKQAQAAIEAHYVEIVDLKNQRDKALEENDRARELCTQAKHQINGLHDEIAQLKSRCSGYQLERDEAVAKFAKLEGFLASLFAQMRAFDIKAPKPQTVAVDAEAPVLELGVGNRLRTVTNQPKTSSVKIDADLLRTMEEKLQG